MIPPTIEIKQAGLRYGNTVIFNNLSVTLHAGQWTALLGQSGIGKSALLRFIANLTLPEERMHGDIWIDNAIPVSEQIAYMAQTDLLLPWLSVLENAMLGMKLRQQKNDTTHVKELLQKVGLANAIHLYPHQLSGGMRQRVALVRTLVENKPIVLMDEPFSAIDTITRFKLQTLAAHLLKNKTVLFITHDPTEALRLANTIYIMHDNPAKLKLAAQLASPTPRALTDRDLLHHQASFFHELTEAAGEAS